MTHLYRLLLIFSSISLTFAIFLVNKGVSVLGNANDWGLRHLPDMPLIKWSPPEAFLATISYLSYFLACLIFSNLGFRATRWLSPERVDGASFKSIELVNDTFLPIYLAYFFVALSTTNYLSFVLVFGVVLLFVYRSGGAYFDPMYVLRGYKIYAATSNKDVKSYIITKQILKGVGDLKFEGLRRVNDFTFIEIGGGE
ncbi:hypothetical protein [Sphingobium chungangianum]|jgi:hypothetical protein